jgi:hypothetical protein
LRISEAFPSGTQHSVELGSPSRFGVELSYPDQIVEFRFAYT